MKSCLQVDGHTGYVAPFAGDEELPINQGVILGNSLERVFTDDGRKYVQTGRAG